jgi:hypothetical protein
MPIPCPGRLFRALDVYSGSVSVFGGIWGSYEAVIECDKSPSTELTDGGVQPNYVLQSHGKKFIVASLSSSSIYPNTVQ